MTRGNRSGRWLVVSYVKSSKKITGFHAQGFVYVLRLLSYLSTFQQVVWTSTVNVYHNVPLIMIWFREILAVLQSSDKCGPKPCPATSSTITPVRRPHHTIPIA